MRIEARADNVAAELALAIYAAALDSVRADVLVAAALERTGDTLRLAGESIRLGSVERIFVVGAGKASVGMARAVEERLGDALTEGVVVTKRGHSGLAGRIRVLEAGHPIPDADSLAAGRAVYDLVQRAGPRDLILALISGGASALMELPREGITLDDLRATTELLLRAGATINELNAVRACLSQLKAGGLARAAHPAQVVCLILSDVLGNPLEVIGSGPFVGADVDPRSALDVLARCGVLDAVPASVRDHLNRMALSPTPKTQHPTPAVRHVILADIWTALDAARKAAIESGLKPVILTGWLWGEAREVAQVFAGIARDLPQTSHESGIDCFIAGGETTVTVRGEGLGGRCQEIVCAAAPPLKGVSDVGLLAAGTDGTDGPTDAAGGLVTGATAARATKLSAEAALRENDAYNYLRAADALVFTGPTDSNVGDLVIVVHKPGEAS